MVNRSSEAYRVARDARGRASRSPAPRVPEYIRNVTMQAKKRISIGSRRRARARRATIPGNVPPSTVARHVRRDFTCYALRSSQVIATVFGIRVSFAGVRNASRVVVSRCRSSGAVSLRMA